ncbi:MAG TPA: TlpA disulfide reductase family protein, partial [Polyangiaceae bacterium]|nr:TlpA disulfide reductase family protein [Polyangiaceae bacterium]
VTACALSVACEKAGSPEPGSVSGGRAGSGTVAPDFTARDVEGNTFRLSDHLGKQVVLLDFWATFCEPCKAEFPHLRAMYDRDKARGLLVVGVAMDGPETVADVPAFVKRFDVDFPIVMDDDSRIASLYNPKKSMPFSVIIDKSGRIGIVREGYNPGDEGQVASDVAAALQAGGSTP